MGITYCTTPGPDHHPQPRAADNLPPNSRPRPNPDIPNPGSTASVQRGIEILPAILCNAGDVTVSDFEWVRNKISVYWSAEEVNEKLNHHMVLAARRVKLARIKYETDSRTASYCAACECIGTVYDQRGVFPSGMRLRTAR